MKKLILVPLCLALTLFSCKSDDDTPQDGGGGGLVPNATYRVTFEPDFTQANFPTDYPTNPTFSGILVAVHEPGMSVFKIGQPASAELQTLAETGDNTALASFLASQGGMDSSDFIVMNLTDAGGPTQAQSVNISIDPDKTSISFLAALSPSPDWFVGVDGQTMIASANSLVDVLEVDLAPLDAGTDSGATYMDPDNPTSPQGVVSVINGAPFSQGGFTPVLGRLRFERTDL